MAAQRHKFDYRTLSIHNNRHPRPVDENDENIQRYFQDISKFKMLSQDEEQEMIKRIKNGDSDSENLRTKLIGSHQPFVIMFAKRHCPAESGQLLDLIQEGNFGMLNALENFDVKSNVKFITYANAWIVKYMYQFLANNELIQRTNRSKTFGVDTKIREQFVKDYGYEPTSQELFEIFNEMGITLTYKEDLDNIIIESMDRQNPLTQGGDDEDDDIGVEYGEDDNFVERIDLGLLKENMSRAMKYLTKMEIAVIRMKFGFDGFEYEDAVIASNLGISLYKVKITLESAYSKLRQHRRIFE